MHSVTYSQLRIEEVYKRIGCKSDLYVKQRYAPLKLAVTYIALTVLISIFGPVKFFFESYHYGIVLLYVSLVILFFSVGYFFSVYSKKCARTSTPEEAKASRDHLLKLALNVSIASLLIELGYLISIGHLNLSFSSFGESYNTRIEDSSTIVLLIRFMSSGCRMISLSLGFYSLAEQDRPTKLRVLANASLYILVFLFGYGTQKGVSDIVIYLSIAYAVNHIKKGRQLSVRQKILIFGILIAVFFLFSYMQCLRYSILGIDAYNYHLHSTGEFYFDTDHPVFKLFGDRLGFGMSSILGGYMSMGYYGLSLCLQLPFEWSYGLGSSYALMKALQKFGITGIYERTYLARMQVVYGRNGLTAWNSIFPWLASDYTFVGVLVLFAFIGYLYGKLWKEIIIQHNYISFMLFCILTVLIAFIPSNNQILHGYDTFVSTWTVVILWFSLRDKYGYE